MVQDAKKEREQSCHSSEWIEDRTLKSPKALKPSGLAQRMRRRREAFCKRGLGRGLPVAASCELQGCRLLLKTPEALEALASHVRRKTRPQTQRLRHLCKLSSAAWDDGTPPARAGPLFGRLIRIPKPG